MAQTTTSPPAAPPSQTRQAGSRPTIVFHRGATTVRAVPDGRGWRVEGDDPALVARIDAALRRPIRAWMSREAHDEVSGAVQIESWVGDLQPDDPRYPFRVANSLNQVGFEPGEFDDITFEHEPGSPCSEQ
jgi:hypothetical protein